MSTSGFRIERIQGCRVGDVRHSGIMLKGFGVRGCNDVVPGST